MIRARHRSRRHPSRGVAVLVAAALAAATSACLGGDGDGEQAAPPVRVASSGDAEGALLGAVLAALLDADGVAAELIDYADARDVRQALELGAVDVAVGYTGETWLATLGRADPPGDAQASFGPVRSHDAREGIVWLPPAFGDGPDGPPANATFAFVVGGPPADDADLRTVSQLATRLDERPDATVCVDREFAERDDGLRAVLDAYRAPTDRRFLPADPDEAVAAVAAGDCLVGLTSATDGTAWAAGLRPLVDDLEVFPAFVIAPQVRAELADARPEVVVALTPFADHLTTARVGTWAARLVTGTAMEVVAAEAATELREVATTSG